MPGVSPPNSEQFFAQIGQLFQRVRALETQQQSTITNQLGQPVLNFGLVPGSNPARYGLQFVDPVSGTEQMFLGESSTGSALTIILEGNGSITVKDSETGTVIAVIGALPPAYNRADGSAQPGLLYYREDGSLAVALADLNPTSPPYKQSFQVLDRQTPLANIVVADDTNSGFGLARPHLATGGLRNTNTTTWPSTTATSFTTIANEYLEVQHPKLQWLIQVGATASTTAQFRLLVNGHQIGTTQTVVGGAGGTLATWQDFQPWPTTLLFGGLYLVELQAMVTAGTGTALGMDLLIEGTQT